MIGAGTMGRQVALQCAMCGLRVSVYDISTAALKDARAVLDLEARRLSGVYAPDPAATIVQRLHFTTDLAEGAVNADLVSENVPEDPHLKGSVLRQAHDFAPANAIFTTNSSTLTPSMFAARTGRPERLLALHFHQVVWETGMVDVMAHDGAAPGLVAEVCTFARRIRQVPIVNRKEHRGYVFNSLLRAYLRTALELWASETASHEDIDRAWMLAHQAQQGPFGAMDTIGLDTVLDIFRVWRPSDADQGVLDRIEALLNAKVRAGHLGAKRGRGFYRYPDPSYAQPSFLRLEPAA